MLVSLAFLASLFISGFAAPSTIKRGDGPGSPYQCASHYAAPQAKATLQSQGANSRGKWRQAQTCARLTWTLAIDLAIAILEK